MSRLTVAAISLTLAAVVSLLARWLGALTWSGTVAATAVGTLTFGFGGIRPTLLLLLFFVSSSLLSSVGKARKRALAARVQKPGARDHGQVLANGALCAVLSVGYGLSGEVGWLVGVAGALAAANSDTWGTELGVLSPGRPRLITTGERVEVGSSGAISWLGSLASLGGAALIAGALALMTGPSQLLQASATELLLAVGLGGLLASTVDSLLGATVQARYHCPQCNRATESHPVHGCGARTSYIGGWRWLGNDQVNLLAGGAGALLAYGMWRLLG